MRVNLRSTTGNVQAAIGDRVMFTGNVSVTTTTGSVQFTWDNARISGDTAINLATTTGSMDLHISQNRSLTLHPRLVGETIFTLVHPEL